MNRPGSSMRGLDGRVVIITGAAGGLGSAEVRRFLAEGAKVVATDLAPPTEPVEHADCLYVAHDISDAHGWAAVVNTAMDKWRRVDVLVNNAGIYWQATIEAESASNMQRMLEVNLVGAFLGIQAASIPMRHQREGSIVNISSTAGRSGMPSHAAYGAAKWGLRGLTRTAAAELGPFGIRVNCLLPGAIDTAMHPAAGTRKGKSRVASPDEIASVVAFLASSDASAITGTDLVVDAGSSVGFGHAPL